MINSTVLHLLNRINNSEDQIDTLIGTETYEAARLAESLGYITYTKQQSKVWGITLYLTITELGEEILNLEKL